MSQSFFLAASLILLLSKNVSAEVVALGGAMHLSWTYTTTNITFTLVTNTTGWAAMGFSPHGGMVGADIVMLLAQNGTVTIQDCYATGTSLPAKDAQQDYKLITGSYVNGQIRATFFRLLDTCDTFDAVITSFTTKVILAFGTSDSSGTAQYHGTTQRVSISLHLLSPEPPSPGDAGIFYLDPKPQNISITAKETTYWCSLVQLPRLDNKTHIIEARPMITPGNEDLVHHMLVYICNAPVNTNVSSFDCFGGSDPGNQNNCSSLIGIWAIGGQNFRFPSNVGLPLENPQFSKYILIQTHYSNMGRVTGRVDNSYLRFVATQTLRPIDAGIIQTGIVFGMLVPPNSDQALVSGYCPGDCLSSSVVPSTGINIFALALHSHLLGRRITLRHHRPTKNTELPVVADDPSYDFDFQEAIHLDTPRVVLPGDNLQTVCIMNSTGRSVPTLGGPGTMQEMCLTFIFYYPKIDLQICQTSPTWMFTPTHLLYQQLGKSPTSFDWTAGTSDGLVGANWSSTLIQTLQNGYVKDGNGFYCRIGQTEITSLTMPPTLASLPPPVSNTSTQKCQSAGATTMRSGATTGQQLYTNNVCFTCIYVLITIFASPVIAAS